MLIIENLRSLDIFFFEEKRFFSPHEPSSKFIACKVADGVSADRTNDSKYCQYPYVQKSLRSQKACGEQKRVAGEKEPKKQARLGKSYEKYPEIAYSFD